MRHHGTFLFAALVALSVTTTLQAQSTFDASRYKPSTLAEIIANSKATQSLEPGELDLVSGEASYRIELTFTGDIRPIDPTTRGFIAFWVNTLRLSPSIKDLFFDEACFKEDDKTYWLPVQSSLMPALSLPANVGALVPLYVVWLGSIGNEQFVFLVNGFDDPS